MLHKIILLERAVQGEVCDPSRAAARPEGNESLGRGRYPEFSYNILLDRGIRVLLISLSGNPLEDDIRQDRDPVVCFGHPSIVVLDGALYFKTSSI
jgi:hypothetical protein